MALYFRQKLKGTDWTSSGNLINSPRERGGFQITGSRNSSGVSHSVVRTFGSTVFGNTEPVKSLNSSNSAMTCAYRKDIGHHIKDH